MLWFKGKKSTCSGLWGDRFDKCIWHWQCAFQVGLKRLSHGQSNISRKDWTWASWWGLFIQERITTLNWRLTGNATSVTVTNSPSSMNSLMNCERLGRVASSSAFGACMYIVLVAVRRLGFFSCLINMVSILIHGRTPMHTYMSGFSVSHSISSSTVILGSNSATDVSEPHTVQSGFFWCSNV